MMPARAKPIGTPVCFTEKTMPNHARGTRWRQDVRRGGIDRSLRDADEQHGDHGRGTTRPRH